MTKDHPQRPMISPGIRDLPEVLYASDESKVRTVKVKLRGKCGPVVEDEESTGFQARHCP